MSGEMTERFDLSKGLNQIFCQFSGLRYKINDNTYMTYGLPQEEITIVWYEGSLKIEIYFLDEKIISNWTMGLFIKENSDSHQPNKIAKTVKIDLRSYRNFVFSKNPNHD